MQFVLITRPDLDETNRRFRAACSARGIKLAEVQAGSVSNAGLSPEGPRLIYRAAADEGACVIEKLLARPGDALLHDPHFPCDHHPARLARSDVPVPRTVFLPDLDSERLAGQVDWLGGYPIVVKYMGLEGGLGISLAQSTQDLQNQFDSVASTPLLQTFIPHAHTWRLTVLGDRVLAATAYTAAPDDFRTNAAGARLLDGQPLPDAASGIAVTATRALRFEFGGVDLMEGTDGTLTVAEVNFPCFFAQQEDETSIDIAGAIVDHLEAKLA